ncbi:hypothetical protein [Psychrobacter urativorans]|uniref:Uncharacterized protein n=1 Tax=Psychrobacter urativorans TaxID=45610 RepID=A0A0M4TDD6_9GAMM|nr:hypothetical protein [Psychrobacter urativorans]ALF60120.1 hypothetical protein AOC03_08780 [Psychrobacter urativorans]
MGFQTALSKIGVGISLSMAVTFSHAALTCKDVKHGNDNYHENMAALAIEARLIDGAEGYFNRIHESVVWRLCGYGDVSDFDIEEMIDIGYVRRSEVEGIKEVLMLDKRSPAGRKSEYARNKLGDMGLSNVGASNIATFYAEKPNSECGKLVKSALAGDRLAIKKIKTEPSYCTWDYDK